MTCKEKLKELYPDYDSAINHIMNESCPENFGLLDDPEDCAPLTEACTRCWDREIPGTATKTDITGSVTITEPQILDSGDRTQFESGAVRDMREGKGRCDLMPLEVVANYICECNDKTDDILWAIREFQKSNSTSYLYSALNAFDIRHYGNYCTMFLEVSKHFEEGAKKYGENNWQKGIPVHCYIDSAVRHYLKWLRGDNDEPHDRAFVWNLMCCIWEVDYREKDEHPTQVAYVCDNEACGAACSTECHHTTDVRHARNFECVGENQYMEKESE